MKVGSKGYSKTRFRTVLTVATVAVIAATSVPLLTAGTQGPRYLFAWAGDADREDSDVIGSFESLYILAKENGRWGIKMRSSFETLIR